MNNEKQSIPYLIMLSIGPIVLMFNLIFYLTFCLDYNLKTLPVTVSIAGIIHPIIFYFRQWFRWKLYDIIPTLHLYYYFLVGDLNDYGLKCKFEFYFSLTSGTIAAVSLFIMGLT
jgi:hypothetical protein